MTILMSNPEPRPQMTTPPAPRVPTKTSELQPEEKKRLDVTEMGRWIQHQVTFGVANRRDLEIDWMKIRHILNGHHYLVVDAITGQVFPDIPAEDDPNDVRAQTNLMRNRQKREHGRRTSVQIKVKVLPRNTREPEAYYRARRAQAALETWREEVGFESLMDHMNLVVLRMGLTALLVEPSHDNSTAALRIYSGADVFPLPGTAHSDDTAEGVVLRQFLSEAWLQESVRRGELHADVLQEAGKHSTQQGTGSPFVSMGVQLSRAELKGAVGYFTYLKPSRQWPKGFHCLSIGQKVYAVQVDENGEPSLPLGGGPIMIWDGKTDSDWYPESYLAAMISLNLEDDRQLSNDIAIAEVNRHGGWTMVPENSVGLNDMQARFGGMVPYKTQQFGMQDRSPFFHVRPPQIGPEGSLVGRRIQDEADETASQGNVNRGQATGRIEADIALQRLIAQTELPNEPFFRSWREGLIKVFERVLDVLRVTWEEEKWVSVVGRFQLPQELSVSRESIPDSKTSRILVGQLVPSSRLETLQLLTAMRDKGDITLAEYKRALIHNGLEPAGLDLSVGDEQFAMSKLLWIYNDGKRPRPWPYDEDFDLEPHRAIIGVARQFTNTIEFKTETDPAVKNAIRQEVLRHQVKVVGELGRLNAQNQFAQDDLFRFENAVDADESRTGPDNVTALATATGSPIR